MFHIHSLEHIQNLHLPKFLFNLFAFERANCIEIYAYLAFDFGSGSVLHQNSDFINQDRNFLHNICFIKPSTHAKRLNNDSNTEI